MIISDKIIIHVQYKLSSLEIEKHTMCHDEIK